jgi:uracil-DNA glycosylase family 4
MPSLDAYHRKWNKCKLCPLHKHAKKHVLYRGSIPAPILFIGEAPGNVENQLGIPFVGPSGQLLNQMLEQLRVKKFLITNIVCCIPRAGSATGKKDATERGVRPPTKEEASLCHDHISELIALAKPKVIITIGLSAKKYLGDKAFPKIARGHIEHPASILRHGGAKSYKFKKALWTLHDFLLEQKVLKTPVLTSDFPQPTEIIGMD